MVPDATSLAMRDFIIALTVLGTIASAASFRQRGRRVRAEKLLFDFEYQVFELTLAQKYCPDELEDWAPKAIAYCHHLIDHEEFKEAIACMQSCLSHLDKLSSL